MGRKHCGKRRNCSLRAISPFPTVFSKGSFPRGVKRRHCVGMGFKLRYQSGEVVRVSYELPPFSMLVNRAKTDVALDYSESE